LHILTHLLNECSAIDVAKSGIEYLLHRHAR